MTKQKTTKKALLFSVLSMMLCIAMLIGSTFAWFTDSVTSGKNQIVAGNLDVELEYTTDFNEWKTVEDATDLFKKDALWEPGHAEVVYLRMRNAGTLALKYKFGMNIVSENDATNVNGETFKLSQYLQYGVVEDQKEAFADRNAAIAAVENPTSLAGYSKEGTMLAEAEPQYLALVVYMPETVGNEANYRGEVVPTIDLGLNLVATQTPHESDSFDNQYDENAEYAYTVKTTDELLSAMGSANAGEKVLITSGEYTISENVNTDAALVVGAGDTVTLNLNNKAIAANHSETKNHNTLHNSGNLTIKNGTIANNDTDTGFGNAAIIQAGGNLKLENCKITNKAGISGSYCISVFGGTVEIKDCTINGDRGGLSVENDASAIVTNCTISAAYYYPLYIYGNGASTFSETTFVKLPKLATQPGNGGNYLIYNDFCPTSYGEEGTAAFVDCKFISTRDGGSKFEVRTDKNDPAFTSLSFVNCSYKNLTNVPDGLTEIDSIIEPPDENEFPDPFA